MALRVRAEDRGSGRRGARRREPLSERIWCVLLLGSAAVEEEAAEEEGEQELLRAAARAGGEEGPACSCCVRGRRRSGAEEEGAGEGSDRCAACLCVWVGSVVGRPGWALWHGLDPGSLTLWLLGADVAVILPLLIKKKKEEECGGSAAS